MTSAVASRSLIQTREVGPPEWAAAYAREQERGGTIHARNARNLTIARGRLESPPHFTPRGVISSELSFFYRGTFVSVQLLFGRRGDGTAEPLLALLPSDTLPACPYAEPALEEVAPQVELSIARAMEALRKE